MTPASTTLRPASTATAQRGDSVDLIAWRYYQHSAMTDAVFAANPGLAAAGPKLPQGTPVVLPAEKPKDKEIYQLWDQH